MRLVKIALANVNTTVGAFVHNVDRALKLAHQMAEEHVSLGLFQEQLVGGYPPEDLIQWQGFVEHQWKELLRFASGTAKLPTVFALGVTVSFQGLRFNCAALVAGGRVLGLVPKEKLPTYNVFYEGRTFSQGVALQSERYRDVPFGDYLFKFDFGVVAAEVCEDIWSAEGPMRRRTYSGAELVVNLSASPFRIGAVETRRELIATRAADHQCTVAFANAVGSNDGLIFDGGGYSKPLVSGKPSRPRWWTLIAPRGCVRRTRLGASTASDTSPAIERYRSWKSLRLSFPRAGKTSNTPCPRSAISFCRGRNLRARRGNPGARTFSMLWHWGWAITSKRPEPSRRSASRCPAGATRCSLCSSPTVTQRKSTPSTRNLCSKRSTCLRATLRLRRARPRRRSVPSSGFR